MLGYCSEKGRCSPALMLPLYNTVGEKNKINKYTKSLQTMINACTGIKQVVEIGGPVQQ